MSTKHTTTPKLFHEDEFRPIINMYNNMDISTSRLFEIINDKAEKITSLNAELLEALQELIAVAKTFEILPSKWIDPLIKADNILNKINN